MDVRGERTHVPCYNLELIRGRRQVGARSLVQGFLIGLVLIYIQIERKITPNLTAPPRSPRDLVSNSSTPFPSCPADLKTICPSRGGREVAGPITGTSGYNRSVPFYLP